MLADSLVKIVLKDCWEYEYEKLSSFVWKANEEVQGMGLSDIYIAATVARSAIPPWPFPMPLIDSCTAIYISVFTEELIAILIALQWIEEIQSTKAVICTDSLSALNSLSSGKSLARQHDK